MGERSLKTSTSIFPKNMSRLLFLIHTKKINYFKYHYHGKTKKKCKGS